MTDQACTTYSVDKEGGLFVFQATQRITYSTKKPVPIKEVIIALQGLEGVLKPVPLVLRELTGIEIERSEFLIQSLQAGSLIEDVVVKFFFGDKDRLDDFVKRLGEKQGMRAVVLSAIVAGVAVYGLHWASGQKAAPMIEATNSVIIQNGAGVMNVDPQVFQAAIEKAAGSKQ